MAPPSGTCPNTPYFDLIFLAYRLCIIFFAAYQFCRSGTGSNQLDPLSIEYPMTSTQENAAALPTSKPAKEKKGKRKAKVAGKKRKKEAVPAPHDSPAMGTRSKTTTNNSPASHTRSKRKILPDLNVDAP
jgi:hypothetical protein